MALSDVTVKVNLVTSAGIEPVWFPLFFSASTSDPNLANAIPYTECTFLQQLAELIGNVSKEDSLSQRKAKIEQGKSTSLYNNVYHMYMQNEHAISAATGQDGAAIFTVNNSRLGTCTLHLKLSSPQFEKLIDLAKNHTLFPIWCTDKSSGRRAGGNYAVFTRVPDYTADASDVSFSMLIADLDIDTC